MDQAPKQEIDIHPGIENTLIMLRHRLKEGVTVVREYDRQLPKINVHGSELNQVWTNLIGNAIDAVKGKGKLKIRTSRDTTHIVVEIIDDGPGIPPDIRTRIFEPFFTTKPIGEGTGLGLDVSRRIIKNHSGNISFESRPGETRFIVKLPLDKRC
jgi:signal transduction histidine kinase